MRSELQTVLVVALVLVAGCNVLSPAATRTASEDTDTPKDVPASTTAQNPTTEKRATTSTSTPTSTPSPTPTYTPAGDLQPFSSMKTLPPNVSAGKSTSGQTLVEAHIEKVRATGFEFQATLNNEPGYFSLHVRNDTHRAVGLVREISPEGGAHVRAYVDDNVSAINNLTTGNISYFHGEPPGRERALIVTELTTWLSYLYLEPVDWKPVGVTTSSGEKRVVLKTAEFNETVASQANLSPIEEDNVQAVEGRMKMDKQGRIRNASITYKLEGEDGETQEVAVQFTVDVGISQVSKPSWLSAPPHLQDKSVTEDNKLIALEHAGGTAIKAGTEIKVGPRYGREFGTATLNESVSQGDTIYLYKTKDGENTTIHVQVNEKPTLNDNATAFSGRLVTVRGSLGKLRFQTAVRIPQDEESS